MPQQWRDNWPPPRDLEDGRDPEERRNSLIHSVGNLTLVNQPLNSLLSNDPWDKKRSTLEDHTTLFLNKDLLSVAPDVWDESAIEERAKRLWPRGYKSMAPRRRHQPNDQHLAPSTHNPPQKE